MSDAGPGALCRAMLSAIAVSIFGSKKDNTNKPPQATAGKGGRPQPPADAVAAAAGSSTAPAAVAAAVAAADAPPFSWDAYWAWQAGAWRPHDFSSCSCKLLMLTANVFSRAYGGNARLRLFVRCNAALAAAVMAATLWLMLRRRALYLRLRTPIMWVHAAMIGSMVLAMGPLMARVPTPPGLRRGAAAPGLAFVWLLFKNGIFFCFITAVTNRLPWQQVAAVNGLYALLLLPTTSGPFCSGLLADSPDGAHPDMRMVASVAAALDFATGQGQTVPAPPLAGGGGGGQLVFRPAADSVRAVCAGGAAGGAACGRLLAGQCLAAVGTLDVYLGVVVIVFFVILAEQVAKYSWLQVHAPLLLASAPPAFRAPTRGAFLRQQLLQLHLLLDVPLLLLWIGFAAVHRPAAVAAAAAAAAQAVTAAAGRSQA